jgi:multiple sugar transport system ATP-binding protein
MADVKLVDLKKSFGSVDIIKGVSLDIKHGEFVVFVGPSGCGKSTLLRMISGLEEISDGDLYIAGKRVNDAQPRERGIAMVFQSYAIFPHMTVGENIGFGLTLAGVPKAEKKKAVDEAARILQMEHLLERKPSQLSGGQRQRVAIGRSIVRKPQVFLFDEPLSNLDAALRVDMRMEIGKLHKDLGATMIYVTHDQVEAMTLADKIVVLNNGQIEQVGAPMELYNSPANEFVASFIGSPKMNFVDGARLGETAKTLGVRPEHITVDPHAGTWKGTVIHAEHLGADTNLYIDTEKAGLLTVRIFGVYDAEPGAAIYATPDPAKTYRFGADGRVIGRA